MAAPAERVVIVGGGIHAVSTAYFLTQRGIKPTVVERSAIAAAASGKAGGFLAREWGDGATVALHRQGYDLHKTLAAELGVESYREVPTLSLAGGGRRKSKSTSTRSPPASWISPNAATEPMHGATAQVTPLELTTKLWAAAERGGATLLIDTVTGVELDEDDAAVTAVMLAGRSGQPTRLPADKVVLAMGPWTGPLAEDWLGIEFPMQGIKSTSIVFADCKPVVAAPFACFCEEDANGCHLELYPRPNGEVYVCGVGGSDYVSGDRLREGGDCESPELIKANPARVEAAIKSFSGLTTLGGRAPDVAQACMRPCPEDGLPSMGEVPGVAGAFISAGHNCWGILWGPISGKAMAEAVADGKASSVDLRAFDPGRFTAQRKKPKRARGRHNGSVEVGEQ